MGALDAIREVAGEPAEVVQLLARLVDHSLLTVPELDAVDARYGLLSAIADFAREKLEREDDADGIRLVHARYFARLYADRDELLRGVNPWRRYLGAAVLIGLTVRLLAYA